MRKKIIIIGSGFSSLSAAAYLAKAGYQVEIYEKNSSIGGRAQQYKKDGFTFDIGPTWYWMPDVFDDFFADFGKKTSDYYDLIKLNPAYSVYFGKLDKISIADNPEEIAQTFESIEPGSAAHLSKFLKDAEHNYNIGVKKIVYRPGLSPFELITPQTIVRVAKFFTNISSQIRKKFKNPRLAQILEFPVIFLGAKPKNIPAFYNFMNHADFGLGTWHPKGGMYKVIEGIEKLVLELGVKIHTNSEVNKISVVNGVANGIYVDNQLIEADIVLSGADYHHSEILLDKQYRVYSEEYWNKKVFAPSALLYFVGFDGKIKNVNHHTLFFDTDFDAHTTVIYDKPGLPDEPLFYASFPSISENAFSPEGKEAAIFLIPMAPGYKDSEEVRELYFEKIITRLENLTDQKLKDKILFKKTYGMNDFVRDYNSYKGNAYGLANILLQTAFLRPKLKSKKVKNLYFTGQLTVPGPGVPPSLISGKVVSNLILQNNHDK
jgi:phytoene desaturase